ncbi:MAG: hypothetical protein MMC33_001752 [Icmadophila ericetorum]|nr:hypothetical protein [Icmadophila ericetorum]
MADYLNAVHLLHGLLLIGILIYFSTTHSQIVGPHQPSCNTRGVNCEVSVHQGAKILKPCLCNPSSGKEGCFLSADSENEDADDSKLRGLNNSDVLKPKEPFRETDDFVGDEGNIYMLGLSCAPKKSKAYKPEVFKTNDYNDFVVPDFVLPDAIDGISGGQKKSGMEKEAFCIGIFEPDSSRACTHSRETGF